MFLRLARNYNKYLEIDNIISVENPYKSPYVVGKTLNMRRFKKIGSLASSIPNGRDLAKL